MTTDVYHIADLLPEALQDLARVSAHAEDRPATEPPHPAHRRFHLPPPRSMNALLIDVMQRAE